MLMAGPKSEAGRLDVRHGPVLYRRPRRFPGGSTRWGLALAQAGAGNHDRSAFWEDKRGRWAQWQLAASAACQEQLWRTVPLVPTDIVSADSRSVLGAGRSEDVVEERPVVPREGPGVLHVELDWCSTEVPVPTVHH